MKSLYLLSTALLFALISAASIGNQADAAQFASQMRAQVGAKASAEEKAAVAFEMIQNKLAEVESSSGSVSEAAYLALAEQLMNNANSLDVIQQCMSDVDAGTLSL